MRRIILFLFCILLIFGGCQVNSAPAAVVNTPAPTPTCSPTPIATTAPEPAPTPSPEPMEASIVVAGDLLCLSAQLSDAKEGGEYHFGASFEKIKDNISAADLAIGNLETLVAQGHPLTQPNPKDEDISDGTETPAADPAAPPADPAAAPSPTSRPSPRVNAPETFLEALADSGFDVLTTANNHVFDYKEDGLTKTLDKLDEYDIPHTGAYADKTEKKPLIQNVNGIDIAILAYTDILNHCPSKSSSYMIDRFDKKLVTSDIAAAKAAGADYIIVCVHWGTEHTHKPNKTQRNIAAFIAEAGADIIFGSHPHCTQPFETIETSHGDVPVLYSLGNFVSSMSGHMNKDGVLVRLELQKEPVNNETSLKSLSYTPTYCAPSPDSGYTVYPADAVSVSQSDSPESLASSRERTIGVLTENVAKAE